MSWVLVAAALRTTRCVGAARVQGTQGRLRRVQRDAAPLKSAQALGLAAGAH